MRKFATALWFTGLLVLSPILATALTIEPLKLETAEGARTGLIARPSQVHAGRPLVILLHGHGGSAEQVFGKTAAASPMSVWLDLAERAKLFVVALDGSRQGDGQRGWNDCRGDAPGNPQTDDVGFVRAVIEKMKRNDSIDSSRIYIMGMSNGGMMAFRLAIELDPPIAAFAAVCAGMADHGTCPQPARPVSALLIDGTADPLVPYEGGQVHFFNKPRGSVIGIERAAEIWRKVDGLGAEADSTDLPQHGARGETHARRWVWGTPEDGRQVELISIENGGHVEPSIAQKVRPVYELIVGKQNHDFECAEEAWRFFQDKHSGPR